MSFFGLKVPFIDELNEAEALGAMVGALVGILGGAILSPVSDLRIFASMSAAGIVGSLIGAN